jgi:hypothetical protein
MRLGPQILSAIYAPLFVQDEQSEMVEQQADDNAGRIERVTLKQHL